jgi:ABC-2 type transport system ATP-binding protein
MYRRTEELLELTGLTDKAEAHAITVRWHASPLALGKARWFIRRKLVLDEPTAGVDI